MTNFDDRLGNQEEGDEHYGRSNSPDMRTNTERLYEFSKDGTPVVIFKGGIPIYFSKGARC